LEEPESLQPFATEEQRDIVIDALGPVPTDIDTLVRHTGMDTGAVQLILLELDLAGRLHRYAGNQVALVPME
jgi:DNA processing protein